MTNLATEYLRTHNKTLAEYDEEGLCGELANELQKTLTNSRIVSVSDVGVFDTTAWTYHTAVMLNGIVHDAWRKKALPLKQWLMRFDCEWPIQLSVDGVTYFRGLASGFDERMALRWSWTIDVNSRSIIVFENSKAFYVLAWEGGEGDFCGLGDPAIPTKEPPFWPIKRWRSPRTLPPWAKDQDP